MSKRKIKILGITPSQSIDNLSSKGNCYIAVSLNNSFYTDKEKVLALMEFIKRHFSSCTIIVADFLHRHNLNIIKSSNDELSLSDTDELGQKIIDFLNPFINNDPGFFEVKRWYEFYSSKEYNLYEKQIMEMYNSDKKFNASILKTARIFVQRLEKNEKLSINDFTKAVNQSIQFILEEIIVFCILGRQGLNIDIYPGTYLQVLKDISLGKFPKAPKVLKNRINIEIKALRKKLVADNVLS